MENLNINTVNIGGNTQFREVIDQPLVTEYLNSMKEGDVFPPVDIVFDGTTNWLVDGFHRYHAYKILGLKVIPAIIKHGTLYEAQLAALKANSKHGKPLTNADKRKKVLYCLSMEGHDNKSDYEIAQMCDVSRSFVGSIRNPEVKQKQKENVKNHYDNKNLTKRSSTTLSGENNNRNDDDFTKAINDLPRGAAPDEDEIKISELALEADQETLYKLLESDEPLKVAHEEIKRLNALVASLEVIRNGLMDEKNVLIKMVKDQQKQIDKLRKIK
jgi:hypothetical protein